MSWTEDRVKLLKQLWGEGRTAADIAKVLGEGVTRNAVIGKAHRLKLSGRRSPIQQNRKDNKKTAGGSSGVAAKARAVSSTRATEKKTVFKGKEVQLADMTERMCRWPSGDPRDKDFSFCGCDTRFGVPYCDEHMKIAYQSPAKVRKLKLKEAEIESSGGPLDLEIRHVANG